MRRLPVSALALALALAPALGLPAAAQTYQPARISVTGEGRVTATPDLALVSVGVVTEGPEAAAALAENSARLAEVMGLVAAAGIAPRDVQTSGLSLAPVYDYERRRPDGQPRILGYQVSNTVTIRVRALEGLGTLLDAVVRGGANQLNGLSFSVSDPEAALAGARLAAARDARARAATLAEGLGVTLGPVLSVVENSVQAGPQPEFRALAAAADGAVPVAAGEVDLAVSVSVEFLILP
ncbi:MAG: SIMPL domain-containing protein [Rhodobacteraceae bacterium]|nr:SIMPL domain-containing protein [Paracoccaceae bacterium]